MQSLSTPSYFWWNYAYGYKIWFILHFRTMDFTSSSLETNGTYFACESNQVPGRRTPLSAVGLGGYYFPQPSSVASDENSPGPACQQFNNGSDNR